MKHYSPGQWQQFFQQGDSPENQLEMENHLQGCDDCRLLFLQTIDQAQMERAAGMILPDFTEHTLQRVIRGDKKRPMNKYYPDQRRLLTYYATAAAITLVLMGGGAFRNLSGRVSQVPGKEPNMMSQQVNSFLFHWPDEVKADFWGQIDKLQWKNRKEVEW